jgi:hypothetical protein
MTTYNVYARFDHDGGLYNMGKREAESHCEAIRMVAVELEAMDDDAVEINAIEEDE